jgi:hypothetical protein
MKKYLVKDNVTGEVVACYQDYAEELEMNGVKKIIAEEGSSDWRKLTEEREHKLNERNNR